MKNARITPKDRATIIDDMHRGIAALKAFSAILDAVLVHDGGCLQSSDSGMKPVKFSELAGGIVLEQDNPSFAAFAAQDELMRLRRQVREQEVEKLISEGRVLPVFKDEVVAFAASIDDGETVSFSEGSAATTRKDWFLSYLARQPKVVSFGAMDLGPDPFAPVPRVQTGAIPDGYHMDRSNEATFFAAQEMAREKSITFVDAVDLIVARGK